MFGGLDGFAEVWAVDFEFTAPPGDPPSPICLVAHELRSGRTVELWEDELRERSAPPYGTGPDTLFVAYYASAEIGCHLALGWPVPERVLDLFTEFRNLTNGRERPCGDGLLGALAFYGLPGVSDVEKDTMRELAMRGGPWTSEERRALLDYCATDVDALARLLPVMLPRIDLPRALLRGRYMVAAARVERTGTPIDVNALQILKSTWVQIQDRLIAEIDAEYGIYDGRSFKAARFEAFLRRNQIAWPRLPSGALSLDDKTFRQIARAQPAIAPLRELRVALSQMRLAELAVGQDGRNRTLLSAFRATSGRNQPSNTRFIFGTSVWLRSLIRPRPGWAVAYIDWCQQEFGIAAALSGDSAMWAAYESGDPYLSFAKQAGAVPPHATKKTHGAERECFKQCALAVQYGQGPVGLAERIGRPVEHGRQLLELHRRTYPVYWRWSDAAVDRGMLRGPLWTVFGWSVHAGAKIDPLSLRNFPMQANGAEMLRLACCLATEAGIRVCAPVHDALLVEAPIDQITHCITETRSRMAKASEIVLGGRVLESEAEEGKVVRYPDRFVDPRGAKMWNTAWRIINELGLGGADVAPTL